MKYHKSFSSYHRKITEISMECSIGISLLKFPVKYHKCLSVHIIRRLLTFQWNVPLEYHLLNFPVIYHKCLCSYHKKITDILLERSIGISLIKVSYVKYHKCFCSYHRKISDISMERSIEISLIKVFCEISQMSLFES